MRVLSIPGSPYAPLALLLLPGVSAAALCFHIDGSPVTDAGDSAPMTPCGGATGDANMDRNQTKWCCGTVSTSTACCAQWPDHPDAALVPLPFGSSSTTADPLTSSLAHSQGPGGILSLVTVTTAATASRLPASASSLESTPSALESVAFTSATAGGSALSTPSTINGATVTTGATGLTNQELAGVVAGLVVVVVVLVSIGCFTAESIYKKRQRRFRAQRMESMKQSYFLGAKSRPLV